MASFLVLALLALPLSAGFPAYPGVDEDVQMAAGPFISVAALQYSAPQQASSNESAGASALYSMFHAFEFPLATCASVATLTRGGGCRRFVACPPRGTNRRDCSTIQPLPPPGTGTGSSSSSSSSSRRASHCEQKWRQPAPLARQTG